MQGTRWRRRLSSPASPAFAGERLVVTNFHPLPAHDWHGSGAGDVSSSMLSIIKTVTLRLYAVTVSCSTWPSHQCLVIGALLR